MSVLVFLCCLFKLMSLKCYIRVTIIKKERRESHELYLLQSLLYLCSTSYLGNSRACIPAYCLYTLSIVHWFLLFRCLVHKSYISLLGLQYTWQIHLEVNIINISTEVCRVFFGKGTQLLQVILSQVSFLYVSLSLCVLQTFGKESICWEICLSLKINNNTCNNTRLCTRKLKEPQQIKHLSLLVQPIC